LAGSGLATGACRSSPHDTTECPATPPRLVCSLDVAATHPRYSRQALYEPIGPSGQAALARGLVVILGCGALGSVSASTLARAGVGHITIVDRDFVEESNLQRQVLFDEADARDALPKAVAASR